MGYSMGTGKGSYAFLNYTSFLKVGKWQLILEGIDAPA